MILRRNFLKGVASLAAAPLVLSDLVVRSPHKVEEGNKVEIGIIDSAGRQSWKSVENCDRSSIIWADWLASEDVEITGTGLRIDAFQHFSTREFDNSIKIKSGDKLMISYTLSFT